MGHLALENEEVSSLNLTLQIKAFISKCSGGACRESIALSILKQHGFFYNCRLLFCKATFNWLKQGGRARAGKS